MIRQIIQLDGEVHVLHLEAVRHLNLHRVELSVEPDNARAVRVYEKLGFVREGMRREHHYDDGCFRDELIMGVLGREFESLDREPARAAARTTP